MIVINTTKLNKRSSARVLNILRISHLTLLLLKSFKMNHKNVRNTMELYGEIKERTKGIKIVRQIRFVKKNFRRSCVTFALVENHWFNQNANRWRNDCTDQRIGIMTVEKRKTRSRDVERRTKKMKYIKWWKKEIRLKMHLALYTSTIDNLNSSVWSTTNLALDVAVLVHCMHWRFFFLPLLLLLRLRQPK